jgi:hypothetical protein
MKRDPLVLVLAVACVCAACASDPQGQGEPERGVSSGPASVRGTSSAPGSGAPGSGVPGSGEAGGGCPTGCTVPPPGCAIKGNINLKTGERVYHVPGQKHYDDVTIETETGERWFCTEDEAAANGWRRSKR